jgi:hypothetical protein
VKFRAVSKLSTFYTVTLFMYNLCNYRVENVNVINLLMYCSHTLSLLVFRKSIPEMIRYVKLKKFTFFMDIL